MVAVNNLQEINIDLKGFVKIPNLLKWSWVVSPKLVAGMLFILILIWRIYAVIYSFGYPCRVTFDNINRVTVNLGNLLILFPVVEQKF